MYQFMQLTLWKLVYRVNIEVYTVKTAKDGINMQRNNVLYMY